MAGTIAAAAAVILAATPTLAATAVQYTEIPLTTDELSNWSPDRTAPSGGHESLATFAGRDNVLEIRIDAQNASPDEGFSRTEGLQRPIPDSDAVRADLYLDPAWSTQDTPVRAGLWGVGHDAIGGISAYPIIEYTTRRADGTAGWRAWDGVVGGWTNVQAPAVPGTWATLEVFRSAESSSIGVAVNGVATQTTGGDTTTLGAVILNQFNYATAGTDYAVHWNRFATGELVAIAGSKDECLNGGYASFGFKNQGQCIASLVAAH